MITIRKSEERGVGRHGWLTTRHSFSFANYYDPRHMGYRSLRVINEDVVEAGRGFGSHHHDNMEIISIVMSGALAHKDSTGGEGVLRRGEVQRMSAGTGVVHSEFNGSNEEPVKFFQIWLMPEKNGITPGYEQKLFPEEDRRNRLVLVAAPGGSDGALNIHQDARVYLGTIDDGRKIEQPLASGRGAWLQVASGELRVNGMTVSAGDGVAIEDEPVVTIEGLGRSNEIIYFDLA